MDSNKIVKLMLEYIPLFGTTLFFVLVFSIIGFIWFEAITYLKLALTCVILILILILIEKAYK